MTKTIALMLAAFCLPTAAFAQLPTDRLALQTDLDHVWTITAAALVFLMQAGFLLLEAGEVRSKNSVNVAQKNLMDFIVSVCLFGAVGYMIMFGISSNGFWGWETDMLFFGAFEGWDITFFVFQMMFCGTAATIVSGAVAERMTINGYLLSTVAIALVIYPVAGHWAWGDLLNSENEPFLKSLGFMDFAGSTVVHSVGAWVALAAIIIIGPRIGKFDENGKARVLHGHSPVLSTCGVVILWVGWIGFNGGSVLTGTTEFAQVVANTIVAGAGGGLSLLLIGRISMGVFRPVSSINGTLGGLVAITAGADVMSPQSAFFVGILGGTVVYFATILLEDVLKLDDPLGAIPVHGFAGAFGTIAVAFFGAADSLIAGSRMDQALVQLQGVLLVFAWAFGVGFAFLKAVDFLFSLGPNGGGLRVTSKEETDGLNVSEHDTPMGTGILQTIMASVANDMTATKTRIDIDYGDEAYEMSVIFNKIMDNIEGEHAAEQHKYETERAKRIATEGEVSEVVKACANGDYSKRLSTEGKKDFLLEISSGINELCDATEQTLQAIGNSLDAVSRGDLSKRIEGDFEGSLAEIQTAINATLSTFGVVLEEVQSTVSSATKGDFSSAISMEGKDGAFAELCGDINSLCQISERGLTELFETLRAVGSGDLTAQMSGDYSGRFADIGAAVSEMADGISDLMGQIKGTADAVYETSTKIAESNQDIRDKSQQQRESLEENLVLLEELSLANNESVSSAMAADALCKTAAQRAGYGRDLTTRTKVQMSEIDAAMSAISEAVALIEEISNQTTMISINASIEAIRGGNEGGSEQDSAKGFQVVAQEVRNLATRTADAAGEIRVRTDSVQAAVSEGLKLVSEADTSLASITDAMVESTQCVERLCDVGAQQQKQVVDIRTRADGVSVNAQDNLALACRTSELSDQLNDEVGKTLDYLDAFTGEGPIAQRAA